MDLVFLHLLLILTSLSLSSSSILLPTTKHPQTHHQLTRLFHTPQLLPTIFVLDLTSPFLWLTHSLNHSLIRRRSIPCSAVKSDQSGLSEELCTVTVQNPVTRVSAVGELVRGILMSSASVDRDEILEGDEMMFVYAPLSLLSGLASTVKGVFGLGRNRVGFGEQVFHSSQLSKKFSLCLSSMSNGMLLFGENDKINEVSKSMIYTPLLAERSGYGYFINVKSLKILDKRLLLQDSLSTMQLSTVAPYSLMESNIYRVFVESFAEAAKSMKLVRVPSVGQFELCYVSKGAESVPVIELVLQSEMVKWKINGHNSMVRMNDEVMCLGVLDGGVELGASIVLGSHQLEDNLLEFDLGSSMLGFSSLGVKGSRPSSCAQLSSSAMRKDVQSEIIV